MGSEIVVDGDLMVFEPLFGNRIVTILVPPIIRGSGHALVDAKKVCVKGDQDQVKLNASYITNSHTVPGTGIVTIKSLDSSQISPLCNSIGSVIKIGNNSFIACFTPSVPAMLPPPVSAPEPASPSYGKGKFIPSQRYVRTM